MNRGVALCVVLAALAAGVGSARALSEMFEGFSVEVRPGPEPRWEGEKTLALSDDGGRLVALLIDLPGDLQIVSGNPLIPIESFILDHLGHDLGGEVLGTSERRVTNETRFFRADLEYAITGNGFGADEYRRGFVIFTSPCAAWPLRLRLEKFIHTGMPDGLLREAKPGAKRVRPAR